MNKTMKVLGITLGTVLGGSLLYAKEQIKDSIRVKRMIKDGTWKDAVLFADRQKQNLSIFKGNINPNPLAEQIKREHNN